MPPPPTTIIVLAKQPVPGRVKTRLCPPCSPSQAARIAEAALVDTLDAALAARADRVVLALDGRPGDWCPAAVEVVGQGSGSLDERLTAAWAAAATGPAVLVGMDTPQIGADELDGALDLVGRHGAVLGPARDGGWWALGLRRPHPEAFAGVPMSRSDTGRRQRDRLEALGLRPALLATRTDVDTWAAALAVARAAPAGRFALAVAAVAREVAAADVPDAPDAVDALTGSAAAARQAADPRRAGLFAAASGHAEQER